MNRHQPLGPEEQEILNIVQKNGPLSKNQIAERSGFKLTSLIRYMRQLERCGLITESEVGESTGGRRPVLYDVSADKWYLIGIDISRLYVQIILTSLKMEILQKHRFPMDFDSTPAAVLDRIQAVIENFYAAYGLDESRILGLGLGTVGPLDREAGIVINPANFIAPGWQNVRLVELLQQRLSLPVFLDNGANTALLAEYYYGIGKQHKNIFYLHCGVGIRTSVISSGKLIRSMNDSEDAFGHMVIDVHGLPCRCGSTGCMECYATIHSITERVLEKIDAGEPIPLSKKDLPFAAICREAEKPGSSLRGIIEESASVLGIGLANMIRLLGPDLVILGGPLMMHSRQFYDLCTQAAVAGCSPRQKATVRFSRGGLLEKDAISIGAAALVLEHYLHNPLIE